MKILYHHIAKCAGSTVTQWLVDNHPGPHHRLNGFNVNLSCKQFRLQPENVRKGYNLLAGHAAIELKNFYQPDLTFTTIRHPVSRFISLYFHFIATGILKLDISLEEFTEEDWQKKIKSC